MMVTMMRFRMRLRSKKRCLCECVRNLRELGCVVAAVNGARAVLTHRGPHLGRARSRDRVQLRGVSGAGGVRGLQRSRGALCHLLKLETELGPSRDYNSVKLLYHLTRPG